MRGYIVWCVVGFLVGRLLVTTVETQNVTLMFAQNSATAAAMVVQTDGANALKVLAK